MTPRTPREIIAEWRKGCSNTPGMPAWGCTECTRFMLKALLRSLLRSLRP
ncbi:MAG: hypothetical protein V3U98_08785 [Acidobacteriota bacterium]